MPLYFAYGSNLCPTQMTRRCPSARVRGRACLHDHQLTFPRRSTRWQGQGVAGLLPASGETVHGVVYQLAEDDLHTLDRFEGVAAGHYTRSARTVDWIDRPQPPIPNDEPVWTYLATPQPGWPFAPSDQYLDTILQGVRSHRLGKHYEAILENWRRKSTDR